MIDEVIAELDPRPGETVCDCTLGGAGHTLEMARRIQPDGLSLGIDQDDTALDAASALSDDPAMARIRDALAAARLRGETPWAAMGRLGETLRIDELRDLSAALALVAEDGAKIRESLGARASSMRRRDLADAEGKAGENSESMLVAQLVVAMGFIVFLVYPALTGIMGSF